MKHALPWHQQQYSPLLLNGQLAGRGLVGLLNTPSNTWMGGLITLSLMIHWHARTARAVWMLLGGQPFTHVCVHSCVFACLCLLSLSQQEYLVTCQNIRWKQITQHFRHQNTKKSTFLTYLHIHNKLHLQHITSSNRLISNIKAISFHSSRSLSFLIASPERIFVINTYNLRNVISRSVYSVIRAERAMPLATAYIAHEAHEETSQRERKKEKKNTVSFNCAKPAWEMSLWITATVNHTGVLTERHKFRRRYTNTYALKHHPLHMN